MSNSLRLRCRTLCTKNFCLKDPSVTPSKILLLTLSGFDRLSAAKDKASDYPSVGNDFDMEHDDVGDDETPKNSVRH